MDLLGLDHFDLVLKMLEHRESIVASILENPALLVQEGTGWLNAMFVRMYSKLVRIKTIW